ncbi:hypothetical protein Hanom_Chr04g00366991 [Helianthus anomalus]
MADTGSSPIVGGKETNSHGDDCSSPCMGNSKGFMPAISKEFLYGNKVHGDGTQPSTYFCEEGEFVGPEVQYEELYYEGGVFQEPSRPSYITTRPKRKSKSNKQKKLVVAEAQVFDIPDLNKQVESDGVSDPFNINAIFRLEEVAARAGANIVIERDFLDSMEENQGERPDYLNSEAEVAHTMDFGYRLGIEVDGFENRGEMEINRDQ